MTGSSQVQAVGHEGTTLEVQFIGGGRYRYRNVPRQIFDEMMASDSKGRFLHERIRKYASRYPFERVET